MLYISLCSIQFEKPSSNTQVISKVNSFNGYWLKSRKIPPHRERNREEITGRRQGLSNKTALENQSPEQNKTP